MGENENLQNVEEKKEEMGLTQVSGFNEITRTSKTNCYIETNIQDQKKIFNLDTHVDEKLNDCKGEMIRVKQVLIKTFEKPLAEPVIDEETGEEREVGLISAEEGTFSSISGTAIKGLDLIIDYMGDLAADQETEAVTVQVKVNVGKSNAGREFITLELI